MTRKKGSNRLNIVNTQPQQDKIRFSSEDLINVGAITDAQKAAFRSYFSGENSLLLTGSAGTGKTFIAMYFALRDVLDNRTPYEQVIVVRSVVPTREVGFLKGSLDEKLEEYEKPYEAICDGLFRWSNSYANLKKTGKIKFISTSFVRGMTYDNAIIILDEAQSCNLHELSSVFTRLGSDSKLIVCGDTAQNDLIYKRNEESGYPQLLKIVERMGMDIVTFQHTDIVRGEFVKRFLIAKDELGY